MKIQAHKRLIATSVLASRAERQKLVDQLKPYFGRNLNREDSRKWDDIVKQIRTLEKKTRYQPQPGDVIDFEHGTKLDDKNLVDAVQEGLDLTPSEWKSMSRKEQTEAQLGWVEY